MSEIRFEIDEPSPTGRAAQVRALVSSTQPPRASAMRNDEKYGSSRAVLAAAALAVLVERGGDHGERVVGVAAPFEAEAHEVHAEQAGGLGVRVVDGPDLLVADRDAVLVDAVLDAPQPRRVRADERVRARVGDRRYCVSSAPPASRAACASTTCASSGGRSEFFANTMPAPVRTHSVSHTVAALGG